MTFQADIFLTSLATLTAVVGVVVLGFVTWALTTRKDQIYRDKYADFMRRKERVDKRIKESRRDDF